MARYWSKIGAFNLPHLYFGGPCWDFAGIFGVRKPESLGYRMCDPVFSRFSTVPACVRRTDGRKDGGTDTRR